MVSRSINGLLVDNLILLFQIINLLEIFAIIKLVVDGI